MGRIRWSIAEPSPSAVPLVHAGLSGSPSRLGGGCPVVDCRASISPCPAPQPCAGSRRCAAAGQAAKCGHEWLQATFTETGATGIATLLMLVMLIVHEVRRVAPPASADSVCAAYVGLRAETVRNGRRRGARSCGQLAAVL
jgi:hypothetical protein